MKENFEQNKNINKPEEIKNGFKFPDTKHYEEYAKQLNKNIEEIKRIRKELGLPDINNNSEK